MINDNNPAARLLRILEEAAKRPDNEPILTVWGHVFKLGDQNPGPVFRYLVLLGDLADETAKLIKDVPDLQHDIYLRCIPSVKQGLTHPNLGNVWGNIRVHFSEKVLAELSFSAEVLSRHSSERPIAPDDLQEIKNAVDGLFEKVLNSSIDTELKEFLLDLLETIRQAVAEYRIRGAKGLTQSVELVLGRLLAFHKRNPGAITPGDDATSLLKDFWTIVEQLDRLTSVALKVKQVAETFTPLLPYLPGMGS